MRKLAALWRRHPILTTAFLAAAALTVLFTVRSVMFTVYWADPSHRDQAIKPWMTPRYVAHSWQLSPDEVIAALEVPLSAGHRKTLGEIATDAGVPLSTLTARIQAAATRLREGQE